MVSVIPLPPFPYFCLEFCAHSQVISDIGGNSIFHTRSNRLNTSVGTVGIYFLALSLFVPPKPAP